MQPKIIIIQLKILLSKEAREEMTKELSEQLGCKVVLVPPSLEVNSLKII
jgi:hypothetical protein